MKSNRFWRQQVNFFISVAFVASFGIFMVTMVLQAVHLTNPIFAAVGVTQQIADQ